MLRLNIEGEEFFDEQTNTFETVIDMVIEFEHSLISLSKWESEYQTPFLASGKKTPEEIFGYLKAMIISPDTDPDVLYRLPKGAIDKIQEYIDSSQSATTFGMMPERRGLGEVITSELIYYWMVAFNIPFECQYWHLNRLFSLIRICNIKNSKPEKMSRHELASRNAALNAKRRAELNTKG
jgi:hypothetical protein